MRISNPVSNCYTKYQSDQRYTQINNSIFLYKATFLLDGWTDGTNFSQEVDIIPVNNGPELDENSIMASPFFLDDDLSTNSNILYSASLLDKGTKKISENKISCTVTTKPITDVEVLFCCIKGGN